MKFCRNCGTEITEEEDLDYSGKCVNCAGEKPPEIPSPIDPPCYICGRPFFIKCEDCGKPLCSVHVKESTRGESSGAYLITKRCPDCYDQKRSRRLLGKGLQIGIIIVVMIIFLIVIPYFN